MLDLNGSWANGLVYLEARQKEKYIINVTWTSRKDRATATIRNTQKPIGTSYLETIIASDPSTKPDYGESNG